jgi:ATP-dependent DNA helicase RecQ
MMDIINPDIPVIALTATATPKVQSDIVKNLGLRTPEIFISSLITSILGNSFFNPLPKNIE